LAFVPVFLSIENNHGGDDDRHRMSCLMSCLLWQAEIHIFVYMVGRA
jgi:hypothetical protein